MTPNLSAFLSTISHSEGTDKAADPYAVTFGYRFTITDFSDHPAVLGTWHGEPLDFLGPAYAGKVSTAAGRYQIIAPTWRTCKKLLHLPDFSPASQDWAAIELIREHGAIDLINSGRISAAIDACHGVWASFPGSTSGQPQAKLATLIQFYTGHGGSFA
jgi:lysozyme